MVPMLLSLTGCVQNDSEDTTAASIQEITDTEDSSEPEEALIDDKYTKHVKNFIGRNASSVGTLRMSGQFRISFDSLDLPIIHITESGEAVNEDNVEEFKVVGQEPAPGFPINVTYEVDEEGEESDRRIESSSINEIILHLERVSSGDTAESKE